MAVSVPLLAPACTGDPNTDAQLVQLGVALFVTALKEYQRQQNIGGEVGFRSDQPTSFQAAIKLLEAFSALGEADSHSTSFDLTAGEHVFAWDGVRASNIGEHLVRLIIPYAEADTPSFQVV